MHWRTDVPTTGSRMRTTFRAKRPWKSNTHRSRSYLHKNTHTHSQLRSLSNYVQTSSVCMCRIHFLVSIACIFIEFDRQILRVDTLNALWKIWNMRYAPRLFSNNWKRVGSENCTYSNNRYMKMKLWFNCNFSVVFKSNKSSSTEQYVHVIGSTWRWNWCKLRCGDPVVEWP